MAYSFYATMGGFVVDVRDMSKLTPQVTLSPNALVILAELGYYVHYNPEVISDKSKANLLMKMLVCVQVTWMVGQCIACKAAEYHITLLELHTMVHVVCALVMYTLWLKVRNSYRCSSGILIGSLQKPLDVTDPTEVDPESVDASIAEFKDESLKNTVATLIDDKNESVDNKKQNGLMEPSNSNTDLPNSIGIIAFLLLHSNLVIHQDYQISQDYQYFHRVEAVYLQI